MLLWYYGSSRLYEIERGNHVKMDRDAKEINPSLETTKENKKGF